MRRNLLCLIGLVMLTIFSCKKENIQLEYQTIEIPVNGTIRAIDPVSDSLETDYNWVISGGDNGSSGYILTADHEFNQFELVADSLEWPVFDQIISNNRFVFSADHARIYYGNLNLTQLSIHNPQEGYWVKELNKKALWQIEATPNMGLNMVAGGGVGKGLVFYSPNNGSNWAPYLLNNEMRGVGYQPPNTIWACGYGLLIKTNDFESGWETVLFENEFFTGIDFMNEVIGVLSTFDGKIYRTSNGESWDEVFRIKGLSDGLSINKIRFLTKQLVVAIGNGGFIAISYDRGLTWKSGSDFNGTNLYDMAFLNDWLYLAGNAEAIYKLKI
jgi:hypothetical protein